MPFQVTVAMLAFIAASILALLGWTAMIASYHIVFAVGIVPLILGAMIYFVPVLTRSSPASRSIRFAPALALLGGILAVSHFTLPQSPPATLYIGAANTAGAVATIVNWAYRLKRKAIGASHPCLNWYLAALACLFAALFAVLIGYATPGHRAELRLLHLHLNTLGFIGITALGTLQVLLPTVVQKPDPVTASRMHTQLKLILMGTLITACGAALHSNITWLGLMLLIATVVGIFNAWFKHYSSDIFTLHGAAPALAAALCGYAIALVMGATRTFHGVMFNPVAVFIIAFLMPLVTGAVSYLLPLWLRPGRQTAWHQAARRYLGYASALRALLFLTAGMMAGLGYGIGWFMALLIVGVFAVQIVLALTLA